MKKGSIKFIVLSILGFILFLMPMTIDGVTNIFIGHFIDFVFNNLYKLLNIVILVTAILTIIISIMYLFGFEFKNEKINNLFNDGKKSLVIKILGYILVLIMMFTNIFQIKYDSEFMFMLTSADTGNTMLGLIQGLFVTFLIGIILMPLLTNFGAVEFIGNLIAPFMKKVFKVPGYAAVDALASFVGDGTIGIVVTNQQYQRGYYTQKEAAIIASNFSIVGISFAVVVAGMLGLTNIFGYFYLTIIIVTVVLAIIMSRFPLKKFKDEYYPNREFDVKDVEEDYGFKIAFERASTKAANTSIIKSFQDAIVNVLSTYISLMPTIMFVGTIALVIATYPPEFLSIIVTFILSPLAYLYELMGFSITDSQIMAQASIIGIADMYLPALFVEGLEDVQAKFMIGVLAFTQMVFFSETGMILLKTKIGFSFIDVIKIFLIRTVISIPIIYLISELFVFMGIL